MPEQEDIGKTLSFTGHRPNKLAGYDREAYRPFVQELSEILYERYYNKGYRRFITGGAQGFDQLAFWALEKMRSAHALKDVANILYVPFQGQERRWKETGVFSQQEYKQMRSRAAQEFVVVPYASSRAEVVSALYARNRAMVDASDRVLALCNSKSWEQDSGGTAGCMQYAKNKLRPIDIATTEKDANGALHLSSLAIEGGTSETFYLPREKMMRT